MKKYLLLLLPVVVVALSCGGNKQKGTPLPGLWEFNQGILSEDPAPNCFLNLEADGRYTLFVPDYFDYGQWHKDETDTNRLRFVSARKGRKYYGQEFSLLIKVYDDAALSVDFGLAGQIEQADLNGVFDYDLVTTRVNRQTVLKRAAVQYPAELDPYSLRLNLWRIVAREPESCREISYRTINYLKHMYALFHQQYRVKAEMYNFRYSPSPLLFGRNGIATIAFAGIPSYWKHTFYDEGQAKQSCAMMYALFDEPLTIPREYQRYDELWSKLLGQMLQHALKKDFCSPGAIDTASVQ